MTEATPEEDKIDFERLANEFEQEMRKVGWAIQDRNEIGLNAALGVAVRDFPGRSVGRNLDYLLFVNGVAVGVAWKAEALLLQGERNTREASSVRETYDLPVAYHPLPFIVFHDQTSAARERSGERFRVTRNTGLAGRTSYQSGFPSPEDLLRRLKQERVFRGLGGESLRWLVKYAIDTRVRHLPVSRRDRERVANLRRYLLVFGLPLVIVFLVWLVIGPASILAMPVSGRSLGAKDFADVRNTTRQVMAALILGTAAVGSLIFAGRTYRLSLRGQRSERFGRAVTQLGSTTNSERVGGIFALEQLMLESPDQHDAIVDVLSHFVREQANGQPTEKINLDQPGNAREALLLEDACQVALTVLGRRPTRPESKPLDLSGTKLTGARLPRAVMRGALLTGTDLRGADLEDADLSGADLTKANLAQASLTGASMAEAIAAGANFNTASMHGADLTKADLNGADMRSAQLNGATLRGARMLRTRLGEAGLSDADLTDAYLRYANLDDAYLVKAVLRDTFLRGAGLRRTNLAKADLRGAYLRLAQLLNARLPQANLSGAMLHRANLSGADLSGANLANADLSGAQLDAADLSGATLEPLKYSLEEAPMKPAKADKPGRISLGDIEPPIGLRPNQLFTAKIDPHTVLPADLRNYLEVKEQNQAD